MTAAFLTLACVEPGGVARAGETAPDPDRSRAEYEEVSHQITLSAERMARLAADVATVKKDHASVTAALIQ